MALWHEIFNQITNFPNPYDYIRNQLLSELHKHTGRDIIVYATAWNNPLNPQHLVTLDDSDIEGFVAVTQNLEGNKLDLILHSPGGSPTVVENLVAYLREKNTIIFVL